MAFSTLSLDDSLSLELTSILKCSMLHCIYLISPLDCKLIKGGDWAFVILVFTVLNTVLAGSRSFKYLDPGESLAGGWTPGTQQPLVLYGAGGPIP